MATRLELCPIWASNASTGKKPEASGYFDNRTNVWHVENSPRAAGGFIIPNVLVNSELIYMSQEQKARLTTWLIDQRDQGNDQPLITNEIIELAKVKSPLAPHQRVDRLLRFIGGKTTIVGTSYDIREVDGSEYAWSESTTEGEIGYLIDYMIKKGWLDSRPLVTTVGFGEYEVPALVRVTVDGRSQIAEQLVNVDSSQAFVAMWFDDRMIEPFEKGIKPAIEGTGYNPFKIDEKLDVDKIDDEIIGEIRRSRFLVADFTHGDKGARGGVYYEAGFAYGLGLPVVRSCRKDIIDNNELHFDVRQHYHVVWETVDELRDGLEKRIRALIGEGPNVNR